MFSLLYISYFYGQYYYFLPIGQRKSQNIVVTIHESISLLHIPKKKATSFNDLNGLKLINKIYKIAFKWYCDEAADCRQQQCPCIFPDIDRRL